MNEVVVGKAIRYAARGVVGVDIAGPRPGGGRYPYRDLEPLVSEARAAGLGVTIHVGEEGFPDEIGEVVETLRPDRIGHGIMASRDRELTRLLVDTQTVLEICPTSNLLTGALADDDAVRETFRAFLEAGVLLTVSTDGPEMMRTHLRDEFDFLCAIGAMSREEARAANDLAHRVSFVHRRSAGMLTGR